MGGPTPGSAGCYMSKSVRDAGYENGACDCEMTAGECLAEPKEGAFPIWDNNGGARVSVSVPWVPVATSSLVNRRRRNTPVIARRRSARVERTHARRRV